MNAASRRTVEYIPISNDIRKKVNRNKNMRQGNVVYMNNRYDRYDDDYYYDAREYSSDEYYFGYDGGTIAVPSPAYRKKRNEFYSPRIERDERVREERNTAAIARPRGVASTIMLIITVFAVLCFLLTRYAAIANYTIENNAVQGEISDIEHEIDQLQLDIALRDDLGYIQERAAELGMGTATQGQIVYVKNDGVEKTPQTADIQASDSQTAQESAEEGTFFSKAIDKIKSLLE